MTSDGSAYARFKRALASANLYVIRAAATELPQVGLRDASEVCLLLRDQPAISSSGPRGAIVRSVCAEARCVTLHAIQAAAAALDAMPERPQDAMESLAVLCFRDQVVS